MNGEFVLRSKYIQLEIQETSCDGKVFTKYINEYIEYVLIYTSFFF